MLAAQWGGLRDDPPDDPARGLSTADRDRFERETSDWSDDARAARWDEIVERAAEDALLGVDPTIPQSRRHRSPFSDSLDEDMRFSLRGTYRDELRAGTGVRGERRAIEGTVRFELPASARAFGRLGYARSTWRLPGGGIRGTEGWTDLLVGAERPTELWRDDPNGAALRWIPELALSAPTGRHFGDAPHDLSPGRGVWTPRVGSQLELTWETYRSVHIGAWADLPAGRRDGRRPGATIESALGYTERHGLTSWSLDLVSVVRLRDSRTPFRPIDRTETSWDLELRPGVAIHALPSVEPYVQGFVPIGRGGSGGGAGVGLTTGVAIGF